MEIEDVIEKISQQEKEARQKVKESKKRANDMIASAEKKGRELLLSKEEDAKSMAQKILNKAKEDAMLKAKEIYSSSGDKIEQFKTAYASIKDETIQKAIKDIFGDDQFEG